MSRSIVFLAVLLLGGCRSATEPSVPEQPESTTDSWAPELPESTTDPLLRELSKPTTFAKWPSVTERPVKVSEGLWYLCRSPSPEENEALRRNRKVHGPHAGYSIVVRVSPDAVDAFRQSRPLPV